MSIFRVWYNYGHFFDQIVSRNVQAASCNFWNFLKIFKWFWLLVYKEDIWRVASVFNEWMLYIMMTTEFAIIMFMEYFHLCLKRTVMNRYGYNSIVKLIIYYLQLLLLIIYYILIYHKKYHYFRHYNTRNAWYCSQCQYSSNFTIEVV